MITAIVIVDGPTVMIRGHQVRECLRRARMRPIYVHGREAQGWCLDRARLADAVAALERGGYDVKLEGSTSTTQTLATSEIADGDIHRDVPEEGGLW